jgi:predicted cobalt transporter CbtA
MLRKLLICGLIVGAVAGLLATGFGILVGEPSVDEAIAYEEAKAAAEAPAAPAGEEEAPLVERSTQKGLGLLTANVVYGLSMGGLFAIAFAFAYGRVARASPRATAAGLALLAFTVVFLIPFLKYPATPPAGSDDDTIVKRTLLYLTMVTISVLAAIAAARLYPLLSNRWGTYLGAVGTGLAYLLVVLVAGLALPAIDELPADFPATTLWEFRVASIGMQALIWSTIGIGFGLVVERVMAGRPILAKSGADPERTDARSPVRT